MKTRTIAKTSLPFFLRAVPAIGITLLGIKLAVVAMTGTFAPASIVPSLPVPLTTTTSRVDPSPLETLLPIANGFQTIAKVEKVLTTDIPMASKNLPYQRRIVLVTLPDGMAQDAVDANLRSVCREEFKGGAMSVLVVGYKASGGTGMGSKQVATLTFAPEGSWGKTDRVYDVCEYSAVIWHW